MNRRNFLVTTTAAFFSTLLSNSLFKLIGYGCGEALAATPYAAITAAVDVLVPPDPNIPGDFKGSDYGADVVLAETLGDAGQMVMVTYLDSYASQVTCNNASFVDLTPNQQLEAIRIWVSERDELGATSRDLLSALLTVSMIGTYERNTAEQRNVLFESMGWYDPNDPGGTFRIPCEGYPDSYQFPVSLKKGLR